MDRRPGERPSTVVVDGMWVHEGVPLPDADWDRVLDDVREERLQEILKTAYPSST